MHFQIFDVLALWNRSEGWKTSLETFLPLSVHLERTRPDGFKAVMSFILQVEINLLIFTEELDANNIV